MRRSHLKIFAAAVFAIAGTVATGALPAFAEVLQDPKPNMGRSEEAKQNDAAFDAQYRARARQDTDNGPKADPWGGVRAPASQTTPAKKPAAKNN